MNVTPRTHINPTSAAGNAVRRELAETLHSVSADCDRMLANSSCPKAQDIDRLNTRQTAACRLLTSLCRPYDHASTPRIPAPLETLTRLNREAAEKIQALRDIQSLRQASSGTTDTFERS